MQENFFLSLAGDTCSTQLSHHTGSIWVRDIPSVTCVCLAHSSLSCVADSCDLGHCVAEASVLRGREKPSGCSRSRFADTDCHCSWLRAKRRCWACWWRGSTSTSARIRAWSRISSSCSPPSSASSLTSTSTENGNGELLCALSLLCQVSCVDLCLKLNRFLANIDLNISLVAAKEGRLQRSNPVVSFSGVVCSCANGDGRQDAVPQLHLARSSRALQRRFARHRYLRPLSFWPLAELCGLRVQRACCRR